jgi:dUTP pyrophosphatase
MTEHSNGVLSRERIAELLRARPPLLSGLPDAASQLQPNGVDLTVEQVERFVGQGVLGVTNTERVLPETATLPWGAAGMLDLPPGAYQVRFTETVNLPAWLMAYARPRSSLLRSGVALHTAVWDAGYSGRGVALMVVYHPAGFRLARGARICQLVFHQLNAATGSGYTGAYQREGIAAG